MSNDKIPSRSLQLLPSLLTLTSVFLGFLAMRFALLAFANPWKNQQFLYYGSFVIFLASLFDGFDGRVARLTNTQSPFGVQLDSFADLISFCVAPTLMMYVTHLHQIKRLGFSAGFLFLACGVLRLARFNVLTSKIAHKGFVGLPTPAAGMWLVIWNLVRTEVYLNRDDLPFFKMIFSFFKTFFDFFQEPFMGLVVTVLGALAMVSNFNYFGLKELYLPKKKPLSFLVFLVLMFSLFLSFGFFFCIFLFLFLYTFYPIVFFFKKDYNKQDENLLFESDKDSKS